MDDDYALQRLAAIGEELRAIRDRVCVVKSNANPRYHGLSQAVSRDQEGAGRHPGGTLRERRTCCGPPAP